MAKIDVIITCFNKEALIGVAIQSVKNQTLEDFECFVIDDGSTDNSEEAIVSAIDNDSRFTHVLLENCGVANARNCGIALGRAPFVCCLDGDDAIKPTFLETGCTGILERPGAGIVYTDALLRHPNNKGDNLLKRPRYTVANWNECDPQEQFKGNNQVPCCNVFRKELWERLGGYRQRYAPQGAGSEDADFWTRIFRIG